MAHLKITIDGTVAMDDDLGQWSTEPPDIIAQAMAQAKPAPWMRALMLTIADAAMTNQAMAIDVQTRGDGWQLAVNLEEMAP